MSVSRHLMLAILSMDSYNREYGAGIDIGNVNIGTVTFNDHEAIGITLEEYQEWQAAGFYAVAYEVGARE